MNKKLLKTLGVVALASVLVTGCNNKGNGGKEPTESTVPAKEVYTVTFHNESVIYNVAEVEEGNTVNKPSDPTKANTEFFSYTFEGWYTEVSLENKYSFDTPVTADLDLYAKYTETHLQVTVTFMNEGEVFATSTIDKGAKVTAPETNPTKEGNEDYRYDFAGWKFNDSLYEFDTEVMTDLTLVASYTEVALRYRVTYLVEGEEYLVSYVNAGETATKPTDPTKADANGYGYTFVGWMLNDAAYNFATPVTDHITLVARFTEAPITYVATVKYGYGGGPADKTFSYTVLNRTEVLEEIKAALPAEDSEYEYEFEGNLPAVLPLESKAYVIHRHDKSFETSFDEPCESLIYMNRQGSENSETTTDGVYTVDANNNVLITEKNYKYFDMEFDVKVTGMTQPRFAILLGLEDSQVDKCYAEVFNSVGANAFMLNGGANNNVRYFKDGNKVETTDYFATIDAPDYANTFVNVKLSVYKDSYALKINNKVVAGIDTSITPKLGHIYFSRADYTGQLSFDNFKVVATDGEKPVTAKSFEADFEDGEMPEQLVWNPRSGEPAVELSDGALKCKFTNGNLYTAEKFTDFDLHFSALIGSGRLTVEFGADETNKGYVGGQSVEGGATGLMFCLDGGGNPVQVRYFKNNTTSTAYTMIYNARNTDTLALRLNGTEYVNFHVQVRDGNCIVEIGDEIVMNQPLGFAHEGHIIFARGNGDGSLTQASFDDISVTDYDL